MNLYIFYAIITILSSIVSIILLKEVYRYKDYLELSDILFAIFFTFMPIINGIFLLFVVVGYIQSYVDDNLYIVEGFLSKRFFEKEIK